MGDRTIRGALFFSVWISLKGRGRWSDCIYIYMQAREGNESPQCLSIDLVFDLAKLMTMHAKLTETDSLGTLYSEVLDPGDGD